MINGISSYSASGVSKRNNVPAISRVETVEMNPDATRINVYEHKEKQQQRNQSQYQGFNPFFAAHILREAENLDQEVDLKTSMKAYSGVRNNYSNLLAVV